MQLCCQAQTLPRGERDVFSLCSSLFLAGSRAQEKRDNAWSIHAQESPYPIMKIKGSVASAEIDSLFLLYTAASAAAAHIYAVYCKCDLAIGSSREWHWPIVNFPSTCAISERLVAREWLTFYIFAPTIIGSLNAWKSWQLRYIQPRTSTFASSEKIYIYITLARISIRYIIS